MVRIAKVELFLPIIKPAKFWGNLFFIFVLFWPHSWPERKPVLKSAPKFGTFAAFLILLFLIPHNFGQSGQNVIPLCHTVRLLSINIANKGKNHLHDLDKAGKDGGRVKLHQDDVSICFSANLHQFGLFQ